jgi:hypothetical protein
VLAPFFFGHIGRHSPSARDEVKKTSESPQESHEHGEPRKFVSREGEQ